MLCYFELLSLIRITLKQMQMIKEFVLTSQCRSYVKIMLYKRQKTNTRKHIASHGKTKQPMQFMEVILFLFSESSKNTNTRCRQNSQFTNAKACGTYIYTYFPSCSWTVNFMFKLSPGENVKTHKMWLVTTADLNEVSRNASPECEPDLAQFSASCWGQAAGCQHRPLSLQYVINTVKNRLTAAAFATLLLKEINYDYETFTISVPSGLYSSPLNCQKSWLIYKQSGNKKINKNLMITVWKTIYICIK
jgi:hypothetical protein